MATTTNYGWTTPDDTALVKDGASAIRTLGSSVDTTTKNLNPETTLGDLSFRSSTSNVNTRIPIGSSGQHLTVVAGVPAWSTASDQTPLTTKGDLFTFSTLDARLGVGANGTTLVADSSEATGLKWQAPAGGSPTVAIFTDKKAAGTQGGTFTSGAFRTRDLQTTQVNQITGASLASNQITLAAGTYYVEATTTCFVVNYNVARLQNITDSSTTILGSSITAESTDAGTGSSNVSGVFTITAQKVFELQHAASTTRASDGFGVGLNNLQSVDVIFCQVRIQKIG